MSERAALRGRSDEVAAALRALRAARDGRPSLLVVRGEPGIGKTALLRAVAEQADRLGFAVGVSAARDDDRVTPLASLGPALRSGPDPLVGADDFLELAALNDQPLWLAERLAALLAQRSGRDPVLVVVDDVQWSDPLSGFALRLLPARLNTGRVCWLLATRDRPGGPAEAVAEAVEGTVPVHRIDLGPLTGEAVLDIAADRLGHPAGTALALRLDSAGGNPFLVTQILDDGAGLRGSADAVRRRLAAASPRCLGLLRAGAVLGGRFHFEDAARLADGPPGVYNDALGAERPDAYADALARGGGSPVAYADALAEAIGLGMLADDGRWLCFRHDLLRQAVYDGIAPSARWSMHRAFADYCLAAGRGAVEAAPHVLATASAGDQAAADVLRTAALDLLSTMATTSVTFIRQADALVAGDRSRSPGLGRDVVRVLTRARQHVEARDFADEVLRDRPASGDQAALVQLLLAPRLWAAGELAELRRRATDPRTAGAAPELRARLAAYAGREPQANQDAVAQAVASAGRAEAALGGSRYAEAAAGFRDAAELAAPVLDQAGAPDLAQLEVRQIAATARFDLDAARAALAAARHADSWHAVEYAWVRADLELGAGRLHAARDAAGQALRLMDDLADHAFEGRVRAILDFAASPGEAPEALWRDEMLVRAAVAAHHRGDRERLDEIAGLLDQAADSSPGAAALVRGLLTGDLRPAVALLATSGRGLLLARAEEEAGRAEIGEPDGRPEAVAALDRALALYEELGSEADAARVLHVLHQAGLRRRRRPPAEPRQDTGWAALTGMERKVARLIAEGHSNRTAAAELVLSPNTVATHLRAAYAKLGVHSRVRLAAVVNAVPGPR